MSNLFVGELRNVSIGVRDDSPAVVPPTPDNIEACARFDEMADGTTEIIPCGRLGRYLVVMLESPERTLRLCEVEVYTQGKTNNIALLVHVNSYKHLHFTFYTNHPNIKSGIRLFQKV